MCPTINMTKIVYIYFEISLLKGHYSLGKKNSRCTEAAMIKCENIKTKSYEIL